MIMKILARVRASMGVIPAMASPSRMPGRRGPKRAGSVTSRVYLAFNRHGDIVELESQPGSELGELDAERLAKRQLAGGSR